MDPESAHPRPYEFMDGISYHDGLVGAPVDVLINNHDSSWPTSHPLPFEHVPNTPGLYQDLSWNSSSHNHGALLSTPQTPLHLPPGGFSAAGTIFDAAFTTYYEPFDDVLPLTQYPSHETIGDDQVSGRAKRLPRIENGYECNVCAKTCNTQGELSKHHLRKHTPKSNWPFVCQFCGRRDYDKRDHGRHVNGKCGRGKTASAAESLPISSSNLVNPDVSTISSVAEVSTRLIEATSPKMSPKRKQRERKQGDHGSSNVDEFKSLDFRRADRYHDSASEALAAATSDVLRFINLKATKIKIEALVPCSHELITFTAVHGINGVGAASTSRGSNLKKRANPDSGDEMATHHHPVTLRKRSADEQTSHAVKKSCRHSTPLNSATEVDPHCSAHRHSPRAYHRDVSSSECAPASPSTKSNVAITLTIRQRPGYQRSVTHPGNVTSADTRHQEPETHSPSASSKKPELRKMIRQVSFSGLRIQFDRHIRNSRGLAWARYTSNLLPGKCQEL